MSTDWFDGRIARRSGKTSSFGSLLDPVADKVLVLATLVVLLDQGVFPAWMVAAIVGRELLISGLRLAALERGVVIAARDLGKLKTWSQAIAAVGRRARRRRRMDRTPSSWWLLLVSVVLTWVSGLDYARSAPRILRGRAVAARSGSAACERASPTTTALGRSQRDKVDRLRERRPGRNRQDFVRASFHAHRAVVASVRALCSDRSGPGSRPRDGRRRRRSADAAEAHRVTGKISVLKVKTITVDDATNAQPDVPDHDRLAAGALRGFALGTTREDHLHEGVLLRDRAPEAGRPRRRSARPATHRTRRPSPSPIRRVTTRRHRRREGRPDVNGTAKITAHRRRRSSSAASITCQLTSGSPSVAGYRVGELVAYTCSGGSLTSIGAGEGT